MRNELSSRAAAGIIVLLATACGATTSVVEHPTSSSLHGIEQIAVTSTFNATKIGDKTIGNYLIDQIVKAEGEGDAGGAEGVRQAWQDSQRRWSELFDETLAGELRNANIAVEMTTPNDGLLLGANFQWIGTDPATGIGDPSAGVKVRVTIIDAGTSGAPIYDLTSASDDLRTLARKIAAFVKNEVGADQSWEGFSSHNGDYT